jgi:hypothetical protein
MVSLPTDLQPLLEKEAAFNRRPVANQIIYILDFYFSEKKKELEYFRSNQLGEAGQGPEPPFYQTPLAPERTHLSKLKE